MSHFTPKGSIAPNGIAPPLSVRLRRLEWSKNDHFRDRGVAVPLDVEQICDISYGKYGVWNLLDVYRPFKRSPRLPVIINVHGGGYFYGDRELYRYYCLALAREGFAVLNFNYRLAPENRFPAPLEDTNNVLHWLKAHEEEYGLDSGNVFLIGDSAGAQIASQYAAIYSDPAYAAAFGMTVPDVTIRSIGLSCGMYDMLSELNRTQRGDIMSDYLGDDYEETGLLDVLSHIGPDYPPTFIFSAHHDFLLPCCEPMGQLLTRRGVENVCKIYGSPDNPSVGHVFQVDRWSNEGKLANRDQLNFFRQHMV